MSSERIAQCFARTKAEKRPALVSFTMAADPDLAASKELLLSLPENGVDVIELGMPFSDPTADGPSIQRAAIRALTSGITMNDTLAMATELRAKHADTPLVLMGYYNPIMQYGCEAFAKAAADAGVDGLIIVDLPPEEEGELVPYLTAQDIALIRLIAPTTDEARLKRLLKTAKGFVYCIAIKGITGAASANKDALAIRVAEIKAHTDLPVVVGFGIRTPEQAATFKDAADGVVVGSAIVDNFAEFGHDSTLKLTQELQRAIA